MGNSNSNQRQFVKIDKKYYQNYIDLVKKNKNIVYQNIYKKDDLIDINYKNFRIIIGKNVDDIPDKVDKKNIVINLIDELDLIKAVKNPILFNIDEKQFDVNIRFVDRKIQNKYSKLKVNHFYSDIVIPSNFLSKIKFNKPLKGRIVIKEDDNIHKLSFKNGVLHKKLGAAYIYKNENVLYKYYFNNGIVHRINKPAIICYERTQKTYIYVKHGYVSSYNDNKAYYVTEREGYYDSETDSSHYYYEIIEYLYAMDGHIHRDEGHAYQSVTPRKKHNIWSAAIKYGKIISANKWDSYDAMIYEFKNPNDYIVRKLYGDDKYKRHVVNGISTPIN